MTLPAFAAERRRLQHGARSALAAIDRHVLSTGRSAANSPAAVAAVDRRDRRTDGRTDTRPLRRPCCAYTMPETSASPYTVAPNVCAHTHVDLHFVFIGCRHGELGRIVPELRRFASSLQFVRCERSRWFARVRNTSSVEINLFV